jgi:outer membrane protein TolC
MRRTLFVGIAVALVAACASDVGATALSLKQCVVRAFELSPQLSSGRHLVEAAKAEIEKKQGATLPYFSSQIQGYEVNGSPVTPWYPLGLFQPENPATTNGHSQNAHWAPVGIESIGVSYPLISQGSMLGLNDPPAVAMARASKDQQLIANVITEQKVIFDVVTDYIYVTEYRAQSATARRMTELASQQLEIVSAQVAVGLKTPQQVQVAAAQLEAAKQALDAANAGESAFAAALASLIGQSGSALQLEDTQLPLSQLQPLNRFLDQVMAGHPALREQRAKVEIARQQLRADNANFWPTAALNTSFSSAQDLDYFNGSTQHPRPTAFLSYLTIDIPLYDFGVRRAAISESKENVLAEKDHIKALDMQIRSEITEAYSQISQYAEVESQFRSSLVRESQAASLASAQYQVGEGDKLAMATAELSALQDKIAIELTEMAARLKYAELQNLSGGTWHWAP